MSIVTVITERFRDKRVYKAYVEVIRHEHSYMRENNRGSTEMKVFEKRPTLEDLEAWWHDLYKIHYYVSDEVCVVWETVRCLNPGEILNPNDH